MKKRFTYLRWSILILSASLTLLPFVAQNTSASDACKCVQATPSETTRWGGNMAIVVLEGKNTYRAMRGVVVDPIGAKIPNVLVEVFDHPEVLLISGPELPEKLLRRR